MGVQVRVSEWCFRRLEAGQRAMVLQLYFLDMWKASGNDVFEFVEFGYKGQGTDNPVMTGRSLQLTLNHITYAQPGMAAGYALVEFINKSE